MLDAASRRVAQLKANGFEHAMVYNPKGVGGTGVVTLLAHGDNIEGYGLLKDPTIPMAVRLWKAPVKWLGNLCILAGLAVAGLHFPRYGPKPIPDLEEKKAAGGAK